jgi:hypothetical protein
LVDEQRRAELAQDPRGLRGALRRVRGDRRIQRLALPDRGVQGALGLLKRRARVGAVMVKDVDVVQAGSP